MERLHVSTDDMFENSDHYRPSGSITCMYSILKVRTCEFAQILSDKRFQGTTLSIPKVTPNEMGAYLCIADNGIPPARSKRVFVYVQCKWATKKLKNRSGELKMTHQAPINRWSLSWHMVSVVECVLFFVREVRTCMLENNDHLFGHGQVGQQVKRIWSDPPDPTA